jgi:hypothetical protein
MQISQVQPISVDGTRRCVSAIVAALVWFNRRLRLRGAGADAGRVHSRLSLRKEPTNKNILSRSERRQWVHTCEKLHLNRVEKSDKKRHETGPSAIANGSLAMAVALIVFSSRLNVSAAEV